MNMMPYTSTFPMIKLRDAETEGKMSKELSILRDIYGNDATIVKATEWDDDGEYLVDGKRVTVDVRWQKIYYEAFYQYYDYVDVGEYRVWWEKED